MARKLQVPDPVRSQTPCAWDGCSSYAFVKIPTKTGWANLCMTHYELHFAKQGDAAMTAAGLGRHAEEDSRMWRRRVFEYWKTLAAKAPMNKRMLENEPRIRIEETEE